MVSTSQLLHQDSPSVLQLPELWVMDTHTLIAIICPRPQRKERNLNKRLQVEVKRGLLETTSQQARNNRPRLLRVAPANPANRVKNRQRRRLMERRILRKEPCLVASSRCPSVV